MAWIGAIVTVRAGACPLVVEPLRRRGTDTAEAVRAIPFRQLKCAASNGPLGIGEPTVQRTQRLRPPTGGQGRVLADSRGLHRSVSESPNMHRRAGHESHQSRTCWQVRLGSRWHDQRGTDKQGDAIIVMGTIVSPDRWSKDHYVTASHATCPAQSEAKQSGRSFGVHCTAQITEVLETFPDGRTNIATLGQQVVRISDIHDEHSYRSATAEVLVDEPAEAEHALQEAAIAAYHTLAAELPGAAPDAPDPGPGLSYSILARVDLSDNVKQSLLEDRDEQHRLETVLGLLNAIYRGLVLTRETQARARRNGRVRTPEELAKELGLDD